MYIEIPDYMTSGEEITYKVGVKNVASFDVNNVKLNLAFDGSECYSQRTIETLKPGETIYLEGTFVANRNCNVSVSDIVDLSGLDESIEWEIKTITVPLKTEVYDDYRNPEIRGERVFAVTAEIYNQKNYDAKNVKAELIFNNPNDVEMIDKYESPELIRKLESLKAGEKIRLEWEFHIKDGVDLEGFGYSVKISADGYEEKIYTNKLDKNYLNKIKIQYEMAEKSEESLQNVKVNIKYNNASTGPMSIFSTN